MIQIIKNMMRDDAHSLKTEGNFHFDMTACSDTKCNSYYNINT